MNPPIDKRKIAESFSRAATTYDSVASIQKRSANHLVDILRTHTPHSARLVPFLEIGAGTGILTDLLLQIGLSRGTITDIAPAMVETLRQTYGQYPNLSIACLDGEHLALGTRFKSILSASTFQWFSSFHEPFLSYWRHLETGGVFAFCMFVHGTLRELHAATEAVGCRYPGHPLPDEHKVLSAVSESRFCIEHFSIVETPLTFPDTHTFLSTLKSIGSTNAVGSPLDPTALRRAIRLYDETYRSPAGVTATYRTLYVLARKLQ